MVPERASEEARAVLYRNGELVTTVEVVRDLEAQQLSDQVISDQLHHLEAETAAVELGEGAGYAATEALTAHGAPSTRGDLDQQAKGAAAAAMKRLEGLARLVRERPERFERLYCEGYLRAYQQQAQRELLQGTFPVPDWDS